MAAKEPMTPRAAKADAVASTRRDSAAASVPSGIESACSCAAACDSDSLPADLGNNTVEPAPVDEAK